ncbi:MAG: hypothetical protein A4S09_15615 [Proteobacteria bacterium SG_bin7]|nr:MAG: hypothetical protein A4S09_15615 [Proteobacteria bacterium SG_bin7]
MTDEMVDANVTYKFKFGPGKERVYEIKIKPDDLSLIEPSFASLPEWTDLEHCKCSHCPLKKEQSPKCPIAKNLAYIADEYQGHKSFEVVEVEVYTRYRNYFKKISLQEGLYSIFGLIMATSSCPHMKFLRPMARFHLPFSNFQETIVRSSSFYLLGQFFVQKNGGKPDFHLKGLDLLYEKVQQVNLGIIERIRSVATGDADANSVTILQGFAQLLSMQLSDDLSEIEPYFTS